MHVHWPYVAYGKEGQCIFKSLCIFTMNTTFFYFFLQNGSSFTDTNCTRMITCIEGKFKVRSEYNCSSNAVCETRNEIRKCYCINGYQGDGEICEVPRNCLDIYNAGLIGNGVYVIRPSNWNGLSFKVYCNMSEDGGWTVCHHLYGSLVNYSKCRWSVICYYMHIDLLCAKLILFDPPM